MPGFDRFTDAAQDIVTRAYEIMMRHEHSQLDTEHIVVALLEQEEGPVHLVLERLGADPSDLCEQVERVLHESTRSAGSLGANPQQVYITPQVKRLMDRSSEEARALGDELISTEHLMLAALEDTSSTASRILNDHGVTHDAFANELKRSRGSDERETRPRVSWKTLEKYSRDLTQAARDGTLDPVIGRDDEIMRVLQVLSRRTKNNPVLIGEAGVGKTAIVEGLAQRIVAGDVPENLLNRHILSLDLGAMVAGARFRGEFEERLKGVLEEVQKARGEIILFIDELHTVVGAGAAQGAIDASNMMKPALARGELQCVGATTLDEYTEYIERDSALERRFAPVFVEEPSVEETIAMLRGLKGRYEEHHAVEITDHALVAAARLSDRYVRDRRLPDKAIDLIDEAASRLRIEMHSLPPELKAMRVALTDLSHREEEAGSDRNYELAAQLRSERLQMEIEFTARKAAWQQEKGLQESVGEDEVAHIVSQWTGVPVSRMQEAETARLLGMEDYLRKRIVGQEQAIVAVSDAIRRARAGLKDPARPIGSFIFLGATGVGKTELAKALAAFLFDDEDALIQIDMSEYGERHTVSRLVGAPPGYVGYDSGGQLTEAVRRRPYRVVLFDEIEKAHADVWNALLQIIEEGRLTDGHGRTVDFRNTVVIMTSNIGTSLADRKAGTLGFLGMDNEEGHDELTDRVSESLKRTFRPEFLNRIDETIVFNVLTREDVIQIVDIQLAELGARLAESGIHLEVSSEAKVWLADQGYDRNLGARPLRRTLQRYLESPLSQRLLRGDLKTGDTVVAVVNTEGTGLSFHPAEADGASEGDSEPVAAAGADPAPEAV
ncbi:MAG: ATP-dependent Clp protease ATP-binding subunit [Anaerolineae bacterium]|jgi:ATP-dependent Clp protease ATP-binding subunit ClpC